MASDNEDIIDVRFTKAGMELPKGSVPIALTPAEFQGITRIIGAAIDRAVAEAAAQQAAPAEGR